MKFIEGLSLQEKHFVYISFFYILYNAFPLLGDLLPIPPQFICIATTLLLVAEFNRFFNHPAIKWFAFFIFVLFFNGLLGRYIHINGLANLALPWTRRILIEIAWILPAILIMSILKQLNNPRLFKIIGYGTVLILVTSFVYILPVITSYSNILRAAMREDRLDFAKPFGLPDYTLMHSYVFMLPGLCLYAKKNEGIKRYVSIGVIILFYYIITQTAVSTSISLGLLVVIATIFYKESQLSLTFAAFFVACVIVVLAYYSGGLLSLVDSLMPFFDGTPVQFKLEDLHDSLISGHLQGDSFEAREDHHQESIEAFFDNPIFGGGHAGGHSHFYDILGTVGLVGFIPFILIIWSSFKNFSSLVHNRMAYHFLLVCFAVPSLFLFHKGIFGATGWLFMCVCAPSLIMAIYYDFIE